MDHVLIHYLQITSKILHTAQVSLCSVYIKLRIALNSVYWLQIPNKTTYLIFLKLILFLESMSCRYFDTPHEGEITTNFNCFDYMLVIDMYLWFK